MKIPCPHCDGNGYLETKEGEGLAGLLEPFVEDGVVGFRLKEMADHSLATIDKLPPLNQEEVRANAEAFANVVEKIHGED
jgi:hypothetical protein